jgi:NADH-ubiquinone oxidoreductase chain 2
LLIMLMSLGGLPPLLGFFPKWISILTIIYEDLFKMVCIFLMIIACINVYIYTRISSSSLLKTPIKLMLKTNSKDKIFHVVMLNLITLPLIFMLSL